MLRVSQYIKLTRLNFELQAHIGQPIPVHAIPSVVSLMLHLERECELMENQIAGKAIVPDLSQPPVTNVVSLAAFYEKRQSQKSQNPNEPA